MLVRLAPGPSPVIVTDKPGNFYPGLTNFCKELPTSVSTLKKCLSLNTRHLDVAITFGIIIKQLLIILEKSVGSLTKFVTFVDIGEENIHRGLSGPAYRNEYGRCKNSSQYLKNITTVLGAAISYSSYKDRQCRMEFLTPQ